MNNKNQARAANLLERRKGHWYQFAEGELDHVCRCMDELRPVSWAADLVDRAEVAIKLVEWLADNEDILETPEWLENWVKLEDLRTTLFEVRYAFDLHNRGITPTYEKETLGNSSVDFEICVHGATFLIELLSTTQTQAMTNQTEHLTETLRVLRANDSEELRKVQGKIVRKVARKDNAAQEHVPHKFLAPEPGATIYNVIIADTRGFAGGAHLEPFDRGQLVFGTLYYLQNGGVKQRAHRIGNQPLAGLFDAAKSGTEALLFRQRIHLLGLVSEEKFGPDQVLQQTRLYQNPFLPDSKMAAERLLQVTYSHNPTAT